MTSSPTAEEYLWYGASWFEHDPNIAQIESSIREREVASADPDNTAARFAEDLANADRFLVYAHFVIQNTRNTVDGIAGLQNSRRLMRLLIEIAKGDADLLQGLSPQYRK